MNLFPIAKLFLHALPPEKAHNMALSALKNNFVPAVEIKEYDSLRTKVWGIDFANPIGLSAGFDKNAEVIDAVARHGFGFIEVGSVTPLPQPGNPEPRLFRLSEDRAAINRLGMNNKGVGPFCKNLESRRTKIPVGANIGKNKTSEDAFADYVTLLSSVYPLCNYVAVNISSPNTVGLRKLQEKEQLEGLISRLLKTRDDLQAQHKVHKPILIKIAPDNSEEQLQDIADLALQYKVDGLIVSNTTTARPESLSSIHKAETGGLSGAPLFEPSTETLRIMYRMTGGKIPLVGNGGIASGADAYTKIKAGASLVQLYTALIYDGLALVQDIKDELSELVEQDGYTSIAEAVGAEVK